jgi:thymidylate synthase (FAD)
MRIIDPSFEILSFPTNALENIEAAARTCYKSEGQVKPGSAGKLAKKLKTANHGAMLEFADATVRFICSRGVSHELVRHRLCSFAQESTRYCNYSHDRFNGEVTVVRPLWVDPRTVPCCAHYLPDYIPDIDDASRVWINDMHQHENSYLRLISYGLKAQEARGVLPIDLKTEIVVKANLREWLHVFELRCASAAHPEMVRLMAPLRDEFTRLCPEVFK